MENVMGSFYSREELHQYCYTLYSLWGQPKKKRENFPKGAIVKLHFFLNASRRAFPDPSDGLFHPKYNLPSTPAIQLALHSPYHLRSPYLEGNNFLVGRSYEIRLTMSEKHLLPAPYQTNCTNYLEEWKLRGGKAPMNQLDVVQECRMKRYYEGMRCVPVYVDYPHEHPICKMCPEEKCNYSTEVKSSVDSCQDLGGIYNQPCDSISYAVTKEQKVISFLEEVNSNLPPSFVNEVVKIVEDETIVRSNFKSVSDVYSWIEEYGRTSDTKLNLRSSRPSRTKLVCW
ncbi:hypothetical protein AVEN_15020-1 [Araneus ventricosus]|uniref:Uncharacterized protein n=1 Tax=Araneus ventricosus TaxID=182803 RepID=A0A4Y2FVC8_ARAVE|nr:hypothetical protein AVEN_15020-1 [Araneus ventricosus]